MILFSNNLKRKQFHGIETFNALKNLYCQNNNITSLNLSSNLNLEELYCQDNQIDSLDLNLNTNLDRLLCYTNGLTSLEINNCSSLESIFCQNNQLTNLDVSQNTSLSYLEFVGNQISSIDLSNNINLVYLYANNNQLTSLDLSLNIALKRLECGDNQIVSLDLTNNTVLDHIYCPSNQLDFLDVKNGNNSNVSWFWANSNPNLTCINVDDTTYSNTNWTNIDPQTYFSNSCLVSIFGCTDPLASNYDSLATIDDGSCNYPNFNDSVTIDSVVIISPILCSGDFADIEVFVDNDTNTISGGPSSNAFYQLKAFKVGVSATFSYFSSSQTNGSSVTANVLDESTYYILIVDSLAFNSTFNPSLQYFSNSTFISNVLTDPSVYDYDSISITAPSEIVNVITSQSNNLCFGDCNASNLISISGGVMPYSIDGNTLSGNDTLLDNLCAGGYSFSISDVNGCILSNSYSSFVISEPAAIQSFDTIVACGLYSWNGVNYDSSGTYSAIFNSNFYLCDSTSYLNLTITPCYGCTDSGAINYDSLATIDDGSCTYLIYGCTDSTALNYDITANIDDQSCLYCQYGCTDSSAINYDSLATCDDGSCIPVLYGCTDSTATNYFPGANIDDGSCIYTGCTDSSSINYNPYALIDDGSCLSYSCQEPAPINLFISDITDNRAVVNWDNMNSNSCVVLKYNIRYREVGSNSWITKSGGIGNGLCNFGVNTISKLLKNLNPGTNYQYKMKAFYCFGGSSTWTLPKYFTTDDICPEMTNLTTQTYPLNTGKVTFSWDSTGAYVFARIALRVNNTGSQWQTAGGFGVYYPSLSVNKFGLQSGTDYRAQGRTFCDSNITSYRSWWTSPVFWTQPGTIRLDGGVIINNLNIYPNPSNDIFNISFNSEELQSIKMRILNILGEVVYKEDLLQYIGEYTTQINLSKFEKSIYFLEIETKSGIINKKLVLQ